MVLCVVSWWSSRGRSGRGGARSLFGDLRRHEAVSQVE